MCDIDMRRYSKDTPSPWAILPGMDADSENDVSTLDP